MDLRLILLVFSFVLALVASYRREPSPWPVHTGWLSFAFFIASILFGGVHV